MENASSPFYALVAELAYAHGLGPCPGRVAGSNPAESTASQRGGMGKPLRVQVSPAAQKTPPEHVLAGLYFYGLSSDYYFSLLFS